MAGCTAIELQCSVHFQIRAVSPSIALVSSHVNIDSAGVVAHILYCLAKHTATV